MFAATVAMLPTYARVLRRDPASVEHPLSGCRTAETMMGADAVASAPIRESRSADADQLLVDELVGGEVTQLTRRAAALDTAERQLGAVGQHQVDVDHARLDVVGDTLGLL